MARYTVELGEIVKSGSKVFNFPYTFYDENKKPEFEQRFIDHFYFREIGVETVGRFQHYLKCKCNEVLPYYNLLLETAQYEYDVKNNYNLTETFTKSHSASKSGTGSATQNGDTTRTGTSSTSGGKTNTLSSKTDHTDMTDFTKNEDVTETGTLDNTTTVDVDGKKVGSDTPNGLLAMSDIKTNVYASRADIEDTTNKTVAKQDTTATKSGGSSEKTDTTASDTVAATSQDTVTENTNDSNRELATNTATNSQNENESGTETYTLERVGDIGVDTTPDKLKKHIELQKVLTTVYSQFFDECEDLFMQIF